MIHINWVVDYCLCYRCQIIPTLLDKGIFEEGTEVLDFIKCE